MVPQQQCTPTHHTGQEPPAAPPSQHTGPPVWVSPEEEEVAVVWVEGLCCAPRVAALGPEHGHIHLVHLVIDVVAGNHLGVVVVDVCVWGGEGVSRRERRDMLGRVQGGH